MIETYLQILTIVAILSIGSTKTESSIAALKRILNELNSQTTSDDGHDHSDVKIAYHPRYYKHPKSKHHDRNSPNLMNVQTMNLYVKPNKRQREEAEIKGLLRNDEERMCSLTGRCGCTGSRCNTIRTDSNLADEVDRIVNEINTQQAMDDDEWRNDRDREHNIDDERKTKIDRVVATFERVKEREEDKDDVDEEQNYDNEGTDKDHDEKDKRLQCNGHNCFDKDDVIQNKRIKISDDVDVVILDGTGLEKLLRNKDFIDLTRNDYKHNEDQEIFKKVLSEYKKFIASDDKTGPHRSSNDITIENIMTLYNTIIKQVIRQVLDYVKNKRPLSLLKLKHLALSQKQKLRNIKTKYRRGDIDESDVEDEVVRIIFGEDSSMNILEHNKNSNDIYLPKWIYDSVAAFKKNKKNDAMQISNDLRVQKRILPLTSQQRERLFNKEKVKTIPKLVWRKNLGQNLQRFGIPFDFEIHGLGQMAP